MMSKERSNGRHCRAAPISTCRCILLASLFWFQVSSANVFGSTTSSSSWNVPLRIGVRSTLPQSSFHRKRRRFRSSSLVASTQSGINRRYQEESADWSSPSSNTNTNYPVNDDEWKALFPDEEDCQGVTTSAATTITPQTMTLVIDQRPQQAVEQPSRGFRQTLPIPAFLTRRKDASLGTYDDYEETVIPCAAVAVSNKVSGKQASFSPTLQTRQKKSKSNRKKGDATLNLGTISSPSSSTAASLAASNTIAASVKTRPLVFWENMVCGAISRSVAQTIMHPANTMKTLLQQPNAAPILSYLQPSQFPTLFRGAGANFILSVPHGAINFAVLEMVRKELGRGVRASRYLAEREEKIGPALDFLSSAISTICCSVVSTPQMMITDNIMAGNYPNLPQAVRGIGEGGIKAFYARGWWPGLVGKIPSYALTWTLFQQLKTAQKKFSGRDATNMENTIMGCLASGTTVSIMIPMDTIKTRLVTQSIKAGSVAVPYKGIVDCAVRVAREEGIKSFYRGLPPRLVSVVPMIGIQFTVYEFMKRQMQKRAIAGQQPQKAAPLRLKRSKGKKDTEGFDPYSRLEVLKEACMEVAASPEHPYPAPHFLRVLKRKKTKSNYAP